MNLEEFELKEKRESGTNCYVYRGHIKVNGSVKDVVLKIEKKDIGDISVGQIIKTDYLSIRKKLTDCKIKSPQLYFSELIKDEELPVYLRHAGDYRFVIVESFDGESIRDLTKNIVSEETGSPDLLVKCKSFIEGLPEDIPLDTNTGNLVYDKKNGELSFVDFLPPDPWVHLNDLVLMKELMQIFPTLDNLVNDLGGRKRYYLNDFRWEKFKFYLNKYSVTPQKLVLP